MIRELDIVALTVDLPEHHLRRGDVGAVVLAHGAKGFEVEFVTLKGKTVAVVSLEAGHVRPVRSREIANARRVEVA